MARGRFTGGGSRAGKPNRLTGAHGDLIAAWDKEAGPKTACELIRNMLEKARGYPVVTETFNADGKLKERVLKHEYNFEPLRSILPYIARKMPETLETPDLAPCTPEELAALDSWWTKARANLGSDKPKT